MVLEVYLYNFVAESKHDGMLSPHPLFDVNSAWWVLHAVGGIILISNDQLLIFLLFVILFKV